MAHAQVGAGSAYAYAAHDANGDPLDGAKTYPLTLPPDPPAQNFWSVDVYDTQTRSLLQTDNPYPSVMSLGKWSPTTTARTPSGSGHSHPQGTRTTGSNQAWPELVPDAPSLRPPATMVRQDLAAVRHPTDLTPLMPASTAPPGLFRRNWDQLLASQAWPFRETGRR